MNLKDLQYYIDINFELIELICLNEVNHMQIYYQKFLINRFPKIYDLSNNSISIPVSINNKIKDGFAKFYYSSQVYDDIEILTENERMIKSLLE